MGIRFTQIVDNRFDNGTKNELQIILEERIKQISDNLCNLSGIQFSYGTLRFLEWEGKGSERESFQWRADCFLIKPRSIKWDDVYDAVNKVKAVYFDEQPDWHIKNLMDGCISLLQ